MGECKFQAEARSLSIVITGWLMENKPILQEGGKRHTIANTRDETHANRPITVVFFLLLKC